MIIVDLGIHNIRMSITEKIKNKHSVPESKRSLKSKKILTFGDSWVEGGGLTSRQNKNYYDNRHKYEIPYSEEYDRQFWESTGETTLNRVGQYEENYALKHSWSGFLDRLVVSSVLNFGEGGFSNQQIISKVIRILALLSGKSQPVDGMSFYGSGSKSKDPKSYFKFKDEYFQPDDIFIIVSWTSMYRSEIYNLMEDGEYTTFGIQSIYKNHNGNFSNTELESFLNIITNTPHIIEKYLQQCLYLHSFLKSLGIKHLFFNSFNETTDVMKSVHDHKLIGLDVFENQIENNIHLGVLSKMIPEDIFYGGSLFGNSQLDFLLKQIDKYPPVPPEVGELPSNYSRLFLPDLHPSELGNELWSNELYNTEQIQGFLK